MTAITFSYKHAAMKELEEHHESMTLDIPAMSYSA
jgi:hypothetical protein